MKKICYLLLILPMLLITSVLFASEPVPVLPDGFSLVKLFEWLNYNWVSLALILSEVAALLSPKWSGIIKSLINILGSIFTKKKALK